jgi:hypothetical protein
MKCDNCKKKNAVTWLGNLHLCNSCKNFLIKQHVNLDQLKVNKNRVTYGK